MYVILAFFFSVRIGAIMKIFQFAFTFTYVTLVPSNILVKKYMGFHLVYNTCNMFINHAN